MKKFIFTIIMAFVAITMSAQTAVQTTKLVDNVSFGLNGGAYTPLSLNSVFPLDGTAGVRIGKDFTPVWGANVEGTAFFGSATDKQLRFDNPFAHNAFRAVNVGLNGTINLTNLFLEYKGKPRTFEVGTVTGIGWLHTFNPSKYADDLNGFSAKTGLNFYFNLGKKKAHQLYIEPAVLWNLNDNGNTGVKFNKHNAWLGLSLGYVYKFKTSNGTHNFKLYDVGSLYDEIDKLNEELARTPKEVVREVVKYEPQVVQFTNPFVIEFEKGKSTLTDKAAELLNLIPAKSVVTIEATASPEGSEDFNQKLSEERAERVATYLINRGVNIKSAKGFGSTGADSQRIVKVFVR